jgi:hypothetical protein
MHVEDISLREQQDLPSLVPEFGVLNYPQLIKGWFSLPWNASDGFGLFHVLFTPDVNPEVQGSYIGKVKDIAEFDAERDNMIRGMSKFMGLLPAASDIPDPPTTQRLKNFIETADDIYGSERNIHLHPIATLSPKGIPARILRQSLVEVFG